MMQNDYSFTDLPGSPGEWTLANTGQRFANFLVDLAVFFLGAVVTGVILGLIGRPELIESMGTAGRLLLEVVLRVSCYFVLEAATGRSTGKLFTRTHVVMEDGSAPTAGVILLRTICRLISFDTFSFLSSVSGWHDTVSMVKMVRVDQ